MRENHPGKYCIVYGVVLDLGRPFPLVIPTTYMRNPITGFHWTSTELEAYPRGFPGFPANCPSLLDAGQGGRKIIPWCHQVMQTMDETMEQMSDFARAKGGEGTHRWREPATLEEVERVRDIAFRPANEQALLYHGRIVDDAARIPAERRSEVQKAIVASGGERPLWAEFRPPKSKNKKVKERLKRLEREQSSRSSVVSTGQVEETSMIVESPPAQGEPSAIRSPVASMATQDDEMGLVEKREDPILPTEDVQMPDQASLLTQEEDELLDFE